MSLAASQRRDQRRRLVLSWNRSAAAASSSPQETRRLADYSPEALPEHQPSLATLLPTGLAGFALAASSLLVLLAAAVGVGLWEAVTGGPLFGRDASRFTATLAALLRCLDVRSVLSLGGWLSQLSLITATGTALVVRLMRRHRRDDFRGRYRAWGWMAGLFMLTACAGQVPLGDLFAALVTDATGVAFGPAGMGWWVLTAGLLYATVGLWAVLPLHERAATGIWLSACLAAWAAAAACGWLAHDPDIPSRQFHAIACHVCWMGGAVLAAIAMLAAARTVLREVRGLPAPATAGKHASRIDTAQATRKSADEDADDRADDDAARHHAPDARSAGHLPTEFVDGSEAADADEDSEHAGRHLSKAERKRLRKLARMSRAA